MPDSNWDAQRRYGRHKSGHAETRNRRERPRARHGKSEQPDRSIDPEKTPTITNNKSAVAAQDDDPAIVEREAKRKEILGLIMKYAA